MIAKLAAADEAGILRFAHQWGLMGYNRLRDDKLFLPGLYYSVSADEERDDHSPGDPIDWIKHHARNLALCLSIVEVLPGGDSKEIAHVIRSYRESVPNWWGRENIFRTMPFYYGDPPEFHGFDRALSERPVEMARQTLTYIVSGHIRGITPYLSLESDDYGAFGVRFRFTAMIELAYLRVARLIQERSQMDRCEECGAIFKKNHGLQRFCPPGQFESESRCSYRHRYKKLKSKEEKS